MAWVLTLGETMTRKHFNKLASDLALIRPSNTGRLHSVARERFVMWTESVNAVIESCRYFNIRFDVDKFREACGWPAT